MSSSWWGIAAAVFVAAVLLLAGVTKLALGEQWRSQATGLGVPRAIAGFVPIIEIAVGAVLLVQWQRHLLAWVAVALFATFSALLALRLAHGQRPPCACFGSFSTRPIGVGHIVRNVVLIAAAVLAATL
ncbi:MAG: hypothetical protein HY826_14745 [Actinobacteria bacterium]|nr:hypothetical protein [Actinomycetota bacterium]